MTPPIPGGGSPRHLAEGDALIVNPRAYKQLCRYFIHETLLVFFTFAAVVAAWQYALRQRGIYLILVSACAALMFATRKPRSSQRRDDLTVSTFDSSFPPGSA